MLPGGKGSRRRGDASEGLFVAGSGKRNLRRAQQAAAVGYNPLGSDPSGRDRQKRARHALRRYCATNLSANGRVLNLADLGSAPELREVSCNFNSRAFCDTCFSLLENEYDSVETLSLAGNNITQLGPLIEAAAEHHVTTQIRNLDLSRNKLSSLAEVELLRHFALAEVLFRDNPIAASRNYRKAVLHALPTVDILDQENIHALRHSMRPKLPLPASEFYFGQGTQDTVFSFCRKFFEALDAQRWDDQLLAAYDPNVVLTVTHQRGFEVGFGTRAKELTKSIRESSHSLLLTRNKEDPTDCVARGRVQALTLMRDRLLCGARTRHEIAGFQVDALPLAGCGLPQPLITATVHGVVEFNVATAANADHGASCRRCFERVLVLAPVPPGQGSEWPARLVNDVWHLRREAREAPVFRPQDVLERPAQPPDAETARQKALVQAFSSATRLSAAYARMCLEAAAWDTVKAQVLFEEKRNSLPDDAWS
eukprot:TRINITY_DN5962_c0_g1_i1.p1 TRINITY_DN5962_c0_g1~~TRINITY_DN5962_c0_g1_i1.p1  ORF type:complete len:521 (+),score=169.42 TRINITY_DN5962_c0_g1_i1:120-1565(+)